MPPRGWIVPVGGSTPDRLKTGKLHPRQISLRDSKSEKTSPAMNLPIDSCFLSSVLCPRVGGSFRSGVQPPTGTKPGATPDRLRSAPGAALGGEKKIDTYAINVV